ncbi:hypothetical protein HNP37_001259 [Flavobacterium nitrogenifigens]|uniref:Uncharacterized protein n=2 Tax=Flavobacterium TaxID=237 RepID=A0A7W7IVK9_9FLAO|nr:MULTISPECIES: hypothetical protein [Flavobacterium]MBB4801220.1 hypothetical protein [Flavobacterium nitrogenifigens]MBB6385032.1 hypothetical protein [Flavobacterium notoginsengisoli]
MKDIEQIYRNDFGISFYWKEGNEVISDKIQLLFKQMGFYFSVQELNEFHDLIEECATDHNDYDTRGVKRVFDKFLLKTPYVAIDLEISPIELHSIKDLVEGSLFRLNLNEYIHGAGMN